MGKTLGVKWKPAGLFERIIAFFIDVLVFLALICSLVLIASLIGSIAPIISAPLGILAFILVFLFFGRDSFFEGRGFGKRLMGLRVVQYDSQEKSCSFKSSVIRTFILIICLYSLILGLWILWDIGFSEDKRRAGDGMANTIVLSSGKFDYKKRKQ
jgi:uncharacterized RDD family membrane protein YckC